MVILRTFREAVQDSEFTITAELTIKREFGKADVLAQAELLREVADIPGVSGAHLMTMGNPEAISAVIKASGLKRG